MTTLTWVLAAMALLAPDRDHHELASAIASVVDAEPPLFRGDAERRRTAAVVVAVAFRESSFRLDAVGDHGRSFCAMQIHRSSGGSAALLEDADACVRKGLSMLRASVRVCPSAPIAWYAEGPDGCSSARAQRISRDRMAIAHRLVREVHEGP
jgi:hypothetical protein